MACDPAALARDVRTFREPGWRLAELRGYDCFPMTQHVECVALLHAGADRVTEVVVRGVIVQCRLRGRVGGRIDWPVMSS